MPDTGAADLRSSIAAEERTDPMSHHSISDGSDQSLRAQREQAAVRLRALEFRLSELQRELSTLNGMTLTAALTGLLGSRRQRAESLQEECDAIRAEQAELTVALRSLEAQIEARPVGDVSTPRTGTSSLRGESAGNTTATLRTIPAADAGALAAIRKAIDAVDDARKEVRESEEIVATLGRCRVADMKGLRALMGAARDRTANDCAGHARRAIQRADRLLAEVMKLSVASAAPELPAIAEELKAWTQSLGGGALRADAVGVDSADAICERLHTLSMVLERLQRDAGARTAG